MMRTRRQNSKVRVLQKSIPSDVNHTSHIVNRHWSGKLFAMGNTYTRQKFVKHLHKFNDPIFSPAFSATSRAWLSHAAANLPHQASPAPRPSQTAEFAILLHEYIPYQGLACDKAPCLVPSTSRASCNYHSPLVEELFYPMDGFLFHRCVGLPTTEFIPDAGPAVGTTQPSTTPRRRPSQSRAQADRWRARR